MRNLKWRLAVVLMFGSAWPVLAQATAPTLPPQEDSAKVQAIVVRYYTLFAQKNLEAWMALWNCRSPILTDRLAEAKRLFMSPRPLRLDSASVENLRLKDGQAVARVRLGLVALEPTTGAASPALSGSLREIEFRFMGDGWSVVREQSAEEALALRLARASDPAALQALLDSEAALQNPELCRCLSVMAGQATAAGNLEVALRLAETAVRVAEKTNNRSVLCASLTLLGSLCGMKGDNAAALTALERSLKLRPVSDAAGTAQTLNSIGLVQGNLGRTDEAVASFRRAASLFESLGKKNNVSGVMLNLGSVYAGRGEYPAARDCFLRALECRDPQDLGGRAMILLNLANAYLRLEAYDQALASAKDSQTVYNGQKDALGEVSAFIVAGQVEASRGRWDEALSFLKEAETLADQKSLAEQSKEIQNLKKQFEAKRASGQPKPGVAKP